MLLLYWFINFGNNELMVLLFIMVIVWVILWVCVFILFICVVIVVVIWLMLLLIMVFLDCLSCGVIKSWIIIMVIISKKMKNVLMSKVNWVWVVFSIIVLFNVRELDSFRFINGILFIDLIIVRNDFFVFILWL